MDLNGFSIYEQIEPVNRDITISFNPDNTYSSYILQIKKDNELYKEIRKINIVPTELTLSETGTYEIKVKYYDENQNEYETNSGKYIIDKEAPILKVGKKSYEVFLGKKVKIMDNVTATDKQEGNITDKITTNKNELDFNTKGTKKLIYTVSDKAGNTAKEEVIINITNSSTSIMIFQMIFTIILLISVLAIAIYAKSIRLERRISKFSISPIKDTSLSLFDNITLKLSNVINRINKLLYKSEFIKKYSKKYTRYLRTTSELTKTSMDFIAVKFISSLICIIIAIFAKTINFKIFNTYDVYLPMIFGFFLPDFIYYFKYCVCIIV